ncbi:hypothetical protein TNCV_3896091 [Trichonephila clavipes]|nr:hypothetical protein TNCV_3896091 [Trichonephila clavipes]
MNSKKASQLDVRNATTSDCQRNCTNLQPREQPTPRNERLPDAFKQIRCLAMSTEVMMICVAGSSIVAKSDFRWFQKKSKGQSSGEREGQATGQPREILLP